MVFFLFLYFDFVYSGEKRGSGAALLRVAQHCAPIWCDVTGVATAKTTLMATSAGSRFSGYSKARSWQHDPMALRTSGCRRAQPPGAQRPAPTVGGAEARPS